MPGEYRGASGEIELEYRWQESASGHKDETTRKHLIGKNKEVELEIENADFNAIKGSEHSNAVRYTISVENLVDLIKQHGKRVP